MTVSPEMEAPSNRIWREKLGAACRWARICEREQP